MNEQACYNNNMIDCDFYFMAAEARQCAPLPNKVRTDSLALQGLHHKELLDNMQTRLDVDTQAAAKLFEMELSEPSYDTAATPKNREGKEADQKSETTFDLDFDFDKCFKKDPPRQLPQSSTGFSCKAEDLRKKFMLSRQGSCLTLLSDDLAKRKNPETRKILENAFSKSHNWSSQDRKELAKKTGLKPSQIYKWHWDAMKRLLDSQKARELCYPSTVFEVTSQNGAKLSTINKIFKVEKMASRS